ncbi:hypothetical protein ASZ90_009266 [hydrocarbon metagenome]|uniref:Uncharacterized protein n=1 Tax=hydrocarbon metagenome TaxID=938273 RepID=A0A0W8FJA8_9ZZZZ
MVSLFPQNIAAGPRSQAAGLGVGGEGEACRQARHITLDQPGQEEVGECEVLGLADAEHLHGMPVSFRCCTGVCNEQHKKGEELDRCHLRLGQHPPEPLERVEEPDKGPEIARFALAHLLPPVLRERRAAYPVEERAIRRKMAAERLRPLEAGEHGEEPADGLPCGPGSGNLPLQPLTDALRGFGKRRLRLEGVDQVAEPFVPGGGALHDPCLAGTCIDLPTRQSPGPSGGLSDIRGGKQGDDVVPAVREGRDGEYGNEELDERGLGERRAYRYGVRDPEVREDRVDVCRSGGEIRKRNRDLARLRAPIDQPADLLCNRPHLVHPILPGGYPDTLPAVPDPVAAEESGDLRTISLPHTAFDHCVRTDPAPVVCKYRRVIGVRHSVTEIRRPLPEGADQVPLKRHRLVEPVDDDVSDMRPGAFVEQPDRVRKQRLAVGKAVVFEEAEVCIEGEPDLIALSALQAAEGCRIIHLPRDQHGKERLQLADHAGRWPPPPGKEREFCRVFYEETRKNEFRLRLPYDRPGGRVRLKEPGGKAGERGDRVAGDGKSLVLQSLQDLAHHALCRDDEDRAERILP